MYLHDDNISFGDVVSHASLEYSILPNEIEKDYYVFIALKLVSIRCEDVVFKGGTSLSKAYSMISRFSEDIDLCLYPDKIKSEGARRRLIDAILSSMDDLGLVKISGENIEHHGAYNSITYGYTQIFNGVLEPSIKIETAHRVKEYPVVSRKISSYITEFLLQKAPEYVSLYNLEPFNIMTVSFERTLIDKLFAIADYYLEGKSFRYSRHLYDVFKILQHIDLSNAETIKRLRELFNSVRVDRRVSKKCISAGDGHDLRQGLRSAMTSDFYLKDYTSVTSKILHENISYNQCKSAVLSIVDSEILRPH